MSKSIFLMPLSRTRSSKAQEFPVVYDTEEHYVKQIIPATGYVIIYMDDTTPNGYFTRPVIAWALCDSYFSNGELRTAVLPMDLDCDELEVIVTTGSKATCSNIAGVCIDNKEQIGITIESFKENNSFRKEIRERKEVKE